MNLVVLGTGNNVPQAGAHVLAVPLEVGGRGCSAGVRILVKYQLDGQDKGCIAVFTLCIHEFYLVKTVFAGGAKGQFESAGRAA